MYALNRILIWCVQLLWFVNLVRIKKEITRLAFYLVNLDSPCNVQNFQIIHSICLSNIWSAVKLKGWMYGRLTAVIILCSHPLQIPMSARIPKVTVVTPTPCVLTLKDRTSVDVLEGTKEMVGPAQVELLTLLLSFLETVFGKCALKSN